MTLPYKFDYHNFEIRIAPFGLRCTYNKETRLL